MDAIPSLPVGGLGLEEKVVFDLIFAPQGVPPSATLGMGDFAEYLVHYVGGQLDQNADDGESDFDSESEYSDSEEEDANIDLSAGRRNRPPPGGEVHSRTDDWVKTKSYPGTATPLPLFTKRKSRFNL